MAAKLDGKTYILSHSSPESASQPPVFLFLSFFFIFCLLLLHGLESDGGGSPTNRDVGRRPWRLSPCTHARLYLAYNLYDHRTFQALQVYPTVGLSVYPSVVSSTLPFIHLCICLFNSPALLLSVREREKYSTCAFSICMVISPSDCPSVLPFIRLLQRSGGGREGGGQKNKTVLTCAFAFYVLICLGHGNED